MAAHAFHRWLAGIAGVLTLAILLIKGTPLDYPDLASSLEFQIVFPDGIGGLTEPIITTGKPGAGDFLAVRYLDATHAVFVYDAWGSGGPVSKSFTIHPNVTRRLALSLPSLANRQAGGFHESLPLRIVLDTDELLHEPVQFHSREPQEAYFGLNPIGGSTASATFRGRIAALDGRNLQGPLPPLSNWHQRLVLTVTQRTWYALGAIAAAIVAYLGIRKASCWMAARRPRWPSSRVLTGSSHPPHVTFLVCLALAALVFATVLTGGTFRFLYPDSFGTFYDHQAQSLLEGRLDVPESALSGEAFVIAGKYYGYFGLTPALLRLPLAALDIGFGQVTRGLMMAYFIGGLVAAYLLLCYATRTVCDDSSWPSSIAVVIFTACAGLGSTMFFLASRAYIYHEASLCATAFALWNVYASLRYLGDRGSRWWIIASICGLLSIHARPTTGLFALCTIGCAALVHVFGTRKSWADLRRHFVVGLIATASIVSFNGISYLKFGTFDGAPLRYHVQYTPARLSQFDGRNFHLSNLAHNFDHYFLQAGGQFTARFPYFYIGPTKARAHLGARMDMIEPTLAMPCAMPGLFFLGIIGGAWAFLSAPRARRPLTVLFAGVAPMTFALCAAVAISHRYTADFCPFLIASTVWAIAVFDAESRWRRRLLLTSSAFLTAFSIFLTLAMTLHHQGVVVWGVPDEVRQTYQALRTRADRFFGSLPE